MNKKILMVILLVSLILGFSGNVIAEEVSVKIELKDGSVIVGEIKEPLIISVDTKYGTLKIKFKDIVSIQVPKQEPLVEPAPKKPSEKVEDAFQWEQNTSIIFTNTGEDMVSGYKEFWEELHKTFPRLSGWCRRSLLPVLEERLERVKTSNTVFMVQPENLTDLEKVEQKYPNLLPVTCSKLRCYSPPFFYFSRDKQTDKIRGVIISTNVYPLLANALTKKVPLDTAFWYKNGQLQILKKKTEEETAKSYQKKSLWEKKWAQEPPPEYTKHRVENPKKYDVQGLRVNADFQIDLMNGGLTKLKRVRIGFLLQS